jgi:hypothetical protein
MRRIAYLGLLLALNGCGFKTWSNLPLTGGSNPNIPRVESENMQRVAGREPAVEALKIEPGDIWPGPLPASQTLQDLANIGSVPRSPLGSPPEAGPAAASARPQGGRVAQPSGTVVSDGGGPGGRSAPATGRGQVIVVPNGNGTNTLIHPDGRIETVPAPK